MEDKSKKILSEVSAGELLDKISILEIKLEKINDKNKQVELKKEYKILKENQNSTIKLEGETKDLFKSLKNVNLKLWDIEDKLRICEKNKDLFISMSFFYIMKNTAYFYNITQRTMLYY